MLTISQATLTLAGTLLLTVVAVQAGGYYLLSLWTRRNDRTPFQIGFARAGHAHAGVLVILALIAQLYVDAASLDGFVATVARQGIPIAAILMPAGFFFSSMGKGRTSPNAFIVLIYLGSVALAAGVIALGIGLLQATTG
jgi:drug/metabolite transporter superfamily protein YnfA